MSPLDEEWLANGHKLAMSMIPGAFRWTGVKQSWLLFFQDDGSTVVVPPQVEIKTVMPQVSTADGPYLLHLPGINGFDLINGILRKATKKYGRKGGAELLGVEKAKEHCLVPIVGDILGGGGFGALGGDEAIQRSTLDSGADTFVERNKASRRLHILG